jgi:hypothetical protein
MTCKQCGLKKDARQVAATIKQQIGFWTMGEMGAHKFQYMRASGGIRGGLAFSIKYKSNRRGYVTIELSARDTYDIEMKNYRRRTIVSKDDIYGDQLKTVLRSGFKKLRGER